MNRLSDFIRILDYDVLGVLQKDSGAHLERGHVCLAIHSNIS